MASTWPCCTMGIDGEFLHSEKLLFSYLNLVTPQTGISSNLWQKLLHTLFTKLLNPFTDHVKRKYLILVHKVQPFTISCVLTCYSDLLI